MDTTRTWIRRTAAALAIAATTMTLGATRAVPAPQPLTFSGADANDEAAVENLGVAAVPQPEAVLRGPAVRAPSGRPRQALDYTVAVLRMSRPLDSSLTYRPSSTSRSYSSSVSNWPDLPYCLPMRLD